MVCFIRLSVRMYRHNSFIFHAFIHLHGSPTRNNVTRYAIWPMKFLVGNFTMFTLAGVSQSAHINIRSKWWTRNFSVFFLATATAFVFVVIRVWINKVREYIMFLENLLTLVSCRVWCKYTYVSILLIIDWATSTDTRFDYYTLGKKCTFAYVERMKRKASKK